MALSIFKRYLLNTSKEMLERQAVTIVHSKSIFNQNHQILRAPRVAFRANLRHFKSKDHDQQTIITVKGNSKFHSITNLSPQQQRMKLKEKHKIDYNEERELDSDTDSDDEYERKRLSLHEKFSERGDSEFWRRKMRTLHRILDVNRDGVISFDDFDLFTKRFISLGHLTPTLAKEFVDVMKQTWIEQFGPIEPYNLITAEQFLTDLHHRLNDEELVKRVGRFLPYLFKAVDYDHSGYLDLNQYKLFFNCLGLSDEDAAISFAVIDKNGDGEISLQEFVHLGRQYFLTEDDTKISKMFWGPLISDH